MTKILVFLLALIATYSFAQKKNAPVFVVGRVINAEDSLKVKDLFYEGLREKTKQNFAESGKNFSQILEIDPSNHAALYELASLHHSQNQEKEAEKYARNAVTVSPENKWYWLLLADVYKKTRNLDQLTLVFDELIKINPLEEDYYFDKANALFIQNKNEDAEKVYEEIEKRFGSSEGLITARQRVYQQQGNSGKASSDLESLISKNPSDVRNYLNLSEVYLKSGDVNKTIETLNRARAINPNDPFISLALADAYKSQGKSAEAFTELKRAFSDPVLSIDAKVQIMLSFLPEFKDPKVRTETVALGAILTQTHPSEAKSYSVYGDVLYQDRQLEKAKVAYKKALELDNQKYPIWEQVLSIEINQRDFAAAIIDGEEALSFFPNQAYLYFYTAIAYAQTKKHEKAISYLKNAASLEVEDKTFLSQIYSGLGDSYNNLKKFKESDQSYEKALQINPDNSYVLNNYAYYLSLRNENLDRAAGMSKRSNELEPDNASFEDTYAWVLFKQKKFKDARVWIEKAIRHNKDNPTQLEHYGDILYNLGEKDQALEQWKLAKAKGEKSEILDKKIYEKKYIE
ncbi:tetratricopeptide repeat protein [Paradesertivirga mongoliensis]|uniref:Tetratricopeptide repeat protein n=1 Tax=Paradesertivirga mongoliensis TaxID=2100740 RepID=A0ABW4ZIY3_9SPHI|nr:tetratricopeptide repeat protein [Pedobacter mongoliensis]